MYIMITGMLCTIYLHNYPLGNDVCSSAPLAMVQNTASCLALSALPSSRNLDSEPSSEKRDARACDVGRSIVLPAGRRQCLLVYISLFLLYALVLLVAVLGGLLKAHCSDGLHSPARARKPQKILIQRRRQVRHHHLPHSFPLSPRLTRPRPHTGRSSRVTSSSRTGPGW